MQKKKDKNRNQYKIPGWLRITLAYGVTVAGILALPLLFALFRKSWLPGVMLVVCIIPLFPTMQASLLRKKPASVYMFFRIYAVEFASFSLQLSLLLVSAPIIAILVAGRLVIVLLIVSVLSWGIVGLQQLGIEIGRKMLKNDIEILFWVTLGLIGATGIFYLFNRLVKKYEDGYFSLWADQFGKVKEFFYYDIS